MTKPASSKIKREKIAKAMKAAGEKVRKEGPSDGRFRKTRGR